jgi:hypothetical protein
MMDNRMSKFVKQLGETMAKETKTSHLPQAPKSPETATTIWTGNVNKWETITLKSMLELGTRTKDILIKTNMQWVHRYNLLAYNMVSQGIDPTTEVKACVDPLQIKAIKTATKEFRVSNNHIIYDRINIKEITNV